MRPVPFSATFNESSISRMHRRLAELVDHLDVQRTAVLEAAALLPHDKWRVRPDLAGWSVADVITHLHRVERGVAKLIAKRASEARQQGHPSESDDSCVLGALDGRQVVDRSRRLQAPVQVQPVDVPDAATALAMLEESRVALRAALAQADGLALGTIRHPHPLLGELDLYQWILFVGQHEARHRTQITEVAAAVASPLFLADRTGRSSSFILEV